jgi:hypothetical protein
MEDCKISSTPLEKGLKLLAKTNSKVVSESLYRQLVGNLIYLTATRPDLSFAVSFIFIFMTALKVEHWTTTKRVLRYVKGTLDFGILYNRSKYLRLCGYTDSDWVGSVDDRKSTSRYVFSFGTGVVTSTSKKQHTIALSLIEAEYRGALKGACEAVWLRRMLSDMQMQQREPTPLFCDNQGVMKLSKNLVFHECTEHFDKHYHFIKQLVEYGTIELQYCPTEDQTTDIFTKSLGPKKNVKFRKKLGAVSRLTIKGGC